MEDRNIRVSDPDEQEIGLSTTLKDFLDANEFDADQEAEIYHALDMDGFYRGGGGASPVWEIRTVA